MISAILAFIILFGAFFIGIQAFWNTTKKEKWQLAKLITYSIMCAGFTVTGLLLFVLAF